MDMNALFNVLSAAGSLRDAESGSNLQLHMLSAADHAARMGYGIEVEMAALLHDVGHALFTDGCDQLVDSIDYEHAWIGASWLRLRGLPERIATLVEAHVEAKRYSAFLDKDLYKKRLSPGSAKALLIQGGPMTADEAAAFRRRLDFTDVMRVRECDDLATGISSKVLSVEMLCSLMGRVRPSHSFRRPW